MDKQEIKELAEKLSQELSVEDRNALITALIRRREEEYPSITARLGQVIKWRSGFPEEQRVGVCTSDCEDCKSVVVMEYMVDHRCLALTRVDGNAKDLEVTDVFIDLSEVKKLGCNG